MHHANVTALADADTVRVAWSASSASDVAQYRIREGCCSTTTVSSTVLAVNFAPLSDGAYTYTVTAVDSYGNESDPSDPATAHVFSIELDQPYSPTSQAAIDLHGSSPRTGDISLHIDTDQGSTDSMPGTTASDGGIGLSAQPLSLGGNHMVVRVTDANGNRSRPTEVWVDRGAVPAAPTGLATDVNNYDVTLSWTANSETDLLGYRVFRNGQVLTPDVQLGELPTATSSSGQGPGNAVDGDAQTFWNVSVRYGNPDAPSNGASLELAWTQPRIVTAANLIWLSANVATGNLDLYGWSGHAWIRLARVRGDAQASQSIMLDKPYRTTRLKLVVHGAMIVDDGSYHYLDLAELQLLERPVQGATTLADTLTDGTYHYQVSAVSNYAFESPLSAPADAAVGDTQGPDAVTLSGDLSGNDANLSWTASQSTDVARYELSRDGNVITSIDAGNTLAYTDANLALGAHSYAVVAYDNLGNAGPPSNTVTLTVTGAPPSIPVNVAVSVPMGGGALDVSWQPGPGNPPAGYALLRATSVDGPYMVIAHPPGTSYHDAPLTNGTTYYYTVEAIDSAGNLSLPSAPASGTPFDNVPPTAPVLTYPTNDLRPISLDTSSSDVCGASEAGAKIDLYRDGVAVGSVDAVAQDVTSTLPLDNSTRRILYASDGLAHRQR